MTDNEIIKALEGCNKPLSENSCTECAFHHSGRCTHNMLNAVLDLINRQKAEIERLKEFIVETRRCDKEIKAEAVKEFAERVTSNLKKDLRLYGNCTFYGCVEHIDNLVKEMVGEDN